MTHSEGDRPPADRIIGRSLPWRYRFISALLRTFYFGRVNITGSGNRAVPLRGARLVVASHRNGAIDGQQVLRAFPGIAFLISVQLLRHPFLRLMFTGIPVVRDKDRVRYGIRRAAYANPVDAACAHLQAGGDLAIFPEGSSAWGPHPSPYQKGAARIARRLLDAGIDLEIVPLGLFYAQPDRFRSRVEVRLGEAITLPPRGQSSDRDWEIQLHQAIGTALDAVSVNCVDEARLVAVESTALLAARMGISYADAFLAAQRHAGDLPPVAPLTRRSIRIFAWLAMLAWSPVLFVGWLVGRKADARNSVTFFRMAGGLAAALLWLPLLIVATLYWPLPCSVLWVLAFAGWCWLGRSALEQ